MSDIELPFGSGARGRVGRKRKEKKKEKKNSQRAHEEDAAQADFAARGELQPPDLGHGQQQDGEVDDDVRDVGADEPGPEVDAAAAGDALVPRRGDGAALEDGGQEGGDAPGQDEGEGHVDGLGEGPVDAEDAQVEAEDGRLDADDHEGVDDFVGVGVDLELFEAGWVRDRLDVSASAVV